MIETAAQSDDCAKVPVVGTTSETFSIADPNNYFPFIDGLRGIAILMVVAVHTNCFVVGDKMGRFVFPYLERLVGSGARGVQLFFMVSAFTLFSSSFRRFKSDRFPITSFYVRRAFRILPFWWLMVLLLGLVAGKPLLQLLPSILFYFGFIRFDRSVEVVPVGWSLFVEECFYLMLPLIFAKISSKRKAFSFLALFTFIHALWRGMYSVKWFPSGNNFVFLFPLNHWYCFTLGILLFFITSDGTSNHIDWNMQKVRALAVAVVAALVISNFNMSDPMVLLVAGLAYLLVHITFFGSFNKAEIVSCMSGLLIAALFSMLVIKPRLIFPPLLLLSVVYLFVYTLSLKSPKLESYKHAALDCLTFAAVAGYIMDSLLSATIAMAMFFLTAEKEHTLCGRITRLPLLMRYGGYCYSIYLFHSSVLLWLEPYKVRFFELTGVVSLPVDIQFIIYFPVVALVALGLGYLSFNLIEKPCVRYGKRFIAAMENRLLLLQSSAKSAAPQTAPDGGK